jgi:ADP-heptose:LPS heptosyltransferase
MGDASTLDRRLATIGRTQRLLDGISRLTPRRPAPLRFERIGVLLQWGIGDATLALPLLQGLKAAHPSASIEVIGEPWLAELFATEASVAKAHHLVPPWTKRARKYRVWERDWRRYAADLWRLRRHRFDLVIGLRLDPRDMVQLRLLSSAAIVAPAAAGGRFWVAHGFDGSAAHGRTHYRGAVAADYCAELVGHRPAVPGCFTPNPAALDRAARQLRAHGWRDGPVVAVAFGAGHAVRRWRDAEVNATLEAVAQRLGFLLIVDDGSDGARAVRAPAGVPHLVWRSDLVGLQAVLALTDVVFCTDSGVMHVAAASGCRLVAVFGPGGEAFMPRADQHRVVAIRPMACRPCYDMCRYSSPICMDQLTAAATTDALAASLGEIAHPRMSRWCLTAQPT